MERESGSYPEGQSPEIALLQSGFRYALSLTHHLHDAEDITQEAWLNLSKRYGGVGSRAALYTAIRNLFIDRCRRARVIAFEAIEDGAADLVSAGTVNPGIGADLEQLLGALRPAEREVIYLHHIDGHTAEEVGVLTGQPRGTVLSLLHRAFKKLRGAAAVSD